MNVRRLVWMVVSALVVVAVVAAPALAQEDPFEPGRPGGEETGGENAAEPQAEEPGGAGEAEEPATTGQTTEGLPETGIDPTPWFVIAYGLIALGAGLVTIARLSRVSPVAVRPSAGARPDAARSAGSSR